MNSSFSFTNPYSQQQSSQNASLLWQHQVRVFLQNGSGGVEPSAESVQKLYHHLQQQQQQLLLQQQQQLSTLEWPWITAKKLIDCCLRWIVEPRTDVALLRGDVTTALSTKCCPSPAVASLLFLMIKSLEQSDDTFTYAAMVMSQDENQSSSTFPHPINLNCRSILLQTYQHYFLKLSSTSSSSSSVGALSLVSCVGLAAAWRTLERIEQLTSLHPYTPDSSIWWLDQVPVDALATTAVEMLLRHELDFDVSTIQPFPTMEEFHLSCVVILSTLFKHNMVDWLFGISDDKRRQLCIWLQSQADRLQLNDRSMTPSLHSLQLAMSSAGLLFLISAKQPSDHGMEQWKGPWSTDMLSHIVRVAFPVANTTPRGPRWTYESPSTVRLLQPWARDLLFICKLCGDKSTLCWDGLDHHWLPFWETIWTKIIETTQANVSLASTNSQKDFSHLESAFLLHLMQPQATRQSLVQLLSRYNAGSETLVPSCRRLLDSLLHLCQSAKYSIAAPASAFLRCFLSEGQDLATRDEFSRSLWASAEDDESVIESFIKLVARDVPVGAESSDHTERPLQLVQLDLLGAATASTRHCRLALRQLGINQVERLIQIMAPKQVRAHSANSFQEMVGDDDDEDTPPTNNLSRIDEKSICMEHEQQEPNATTLDCAIRFSAATILAHVLECATLSSMEKNNGHEPIRIDNETHVMLGRVRTALGDFLCNAMLSINNILSEIPTSLDITRRQLRVTVVYAGCENDMCLASALHSSQMLRRRQVEETNRELESCRELLSLAQTRQVAHELEKNRWKREREVKSILFQRELARCKQNAVQDAHQQVKIHAEERARTERKNEELVKRFEQAEAALTEAESRVQCHLQAEARTHDALENATLEIQELNAKLVGERQLRADREAEAEQIASELETTVQLLNEAKEQQIVLQNHVQEKDEELDGLRNSYGVLQDNLENLFADMVSLTRLYQVKEQELADARNRNERSLKDVKEQLERERRRNEELERKEREVRHENERLTKKLARSKEKLELERKERHDESQRRQQQRLGPISYLNQLHNSTNSADRSGRDSNKNNNKTWDKSVNSSRKDSSRW